MNFGSLQIRVVPVLVCLSVLSFAAPSRVGAQFPTPPPDTTTPRANAPFDLTGYWVAVVTEDWRYRMVTPEKGDFPGVPVNAAARRVANTWDPAKDEASGNQCKSYGAAAIMRVPTRLHISWVDDTTLKVETDAGTQTRVFHFGSPPPAEATPTWQGYSVPSWEAQRPRGFVLPVVAGSGATGARPGQEGYLKVITTQLRSGYLRKNGVPYSPNAVVEEYFDSFKEPDGNTWLVVTTIVTDPQYLDNSYITSSQFKKLPDASGWNPTPCEAR
jgi:hypothetical protein